MSIEAIGYVMTLRLPASEKWLMVGLANHADPYGDSIFPALETLKDELGMSRPTLKRMFKKVLSLGLVERTAEATPVSPAFYRIVGVPVPKEFVRERTCPQVLRRAVILTFDSTCEYCHRPSVSRELDPDGKPWIIDRVVLGLRGGVYSPDNVTLCCRACSTKRKASPAPAGTRTLRQLQRLRGVQNEPPAITGEGVHGEPPEDVALDPPGVHGDPPEGIKLNPEPCTESCMDPSLNLKAVAAPRRQPHEKPEDNLNVITVLAHAVYDLLGPPRTASEVGEYTENLKQRCADEGIAYDSDVVRKALDSALWQRNHASRRSAS